MNRDLELERDLLRRTGSPAGFVEQVLARINWAEANGLNGWDKPLDEILAESQEEAADIPGWAIGAALQLPPSLHHRLVVPMSLAGVAWRELGELRVLLAGESGLPPR